MRAFLEFLRRRAVPACAVILGLIQLPFGAADKSRTALSKPSEEVTLDTVYLGELMEERPYSTLIPYFEDLLQRRRYTGRIDSIFLLKSLGRMAIAEVETREKGKAYLARAASMNPGAAVWEVYDAQLRLDYAQANEAALAESSPLPPSSPVEENANASTTSWYERKGLWWAAGGVGLAMIAATITYVLLQEPQSSERVDHSLLVTTNSR